MEREEGKKGEEGGEVEEKREGIDCVISVTR